MPLWPQTLARPDPGINISTFGPGGTAQNIGFGGAPASAAWGAGNGAVLYPYLLTRPFPAKILYCINGATAGGNVDVGIYLPDPSSTLAIRLCSGGGAAQAGTNAEQIFTLSSMVVIPPGLIYIALVNSGTTGTFFRTASNVSIGTMLGNASAASVYPLPPTLTLARVTTALNMNAVCGAGSRSFL